MDPKLALTKAMARWLHTWLTEPEKHAMLVKALLKKYADMPLWDGTAHRMGDATGNLWHKTAAAAKKYQPRESRAFKISVTDAVDLERVAEFLSQWFPEHRKEFVLFAKSSPLLVFDTARARKSVNQNDVDWGSDEEDDVPESDEPIEEPPVTPLRRKVIRRAPSAPTTEEELAALYSEGTSTKGQRDTIMRLAWSIFNAKYFKSRLIPTPLFWQTLPPAFRKFHGKGGADFYARGLWVYGHPKVQGGRALFIHPRVFLAQWPAFRKVMLHEMCHEAVSDIHGIPASVADSKGTEGHGPLWRAFMHEIGEPVERYDTSDRMQYMKDHEKEKEERVRNTFKVMQGGVRAPVPGDLVFYVDVTNPADAPIPAVIMAKAPLRASDKKIQRYYLMDMERMRNPGPPWPRIPVNHMSTGMALPYNYNEINALEANWYEVFVAHKQDFIK